MNYKYLPINFHTTVSTLITGHGTTHKENAIIIQTGKIVPPSKSDKIQIEQVAAKRRYEVETKISSDKDNF